MELVSFITVLCHSSVQGSITHFFFCQPSIVSSSVFSVFSPFVSRFSACFAFGMRHLVTEVSKLLSRHDACIPDAIVCYEYGTLGNGDKFISAGTVAGRRKFSDGLHRILVQ
jgi:hypothetical protein